MSVWKHRPRDAHGGLRQQGTSGLRKRLDPDEACLSGTDRPTDSVMRCDAMRCAVALLLDAVLRRGRIAVCWAWGRAEQGGPSQRARTCPDVLYVVVHSTVPYSRTYRRGERDHETCPLYE